MAGNTYGHLLKITTFGESHGPAIGVVMDGVPSGIPLSEQDIQFDLDRRRPGQSRVTTQRQETDRVTILSGVFEGKTTGTALALLIQNQDQRSRDYSAIKDVFRPGHADYTYFMKYGRRDYRGGGRSSGRETAARVAAGSVAKKILDKENIRVIAYTRSVGSVSATKVDYAVIEQNLVRAPDLEAAARMEEVIDEARRQCDSIGGIIEGVVHGCPAGLGDPVFDKLTARLAQGLLSIGSVRGIEFGRGFQAAAMKGSEHNDAFFMDGDRVRTRTNNCGGILGGISTGGDIVFRLAVKPTPSIAQTQHTVSVDQKDTTIQIKGRHDPCICPRIVPVVEAMTALTLADALLIQRATRSDE